MARNEEEATILTPEIISRVMREMGRKGGSVTGVAKGFAARKAKQRQRIARSGAQARAAQLTPERRKEIAKKAAEARWARKKAGGPARSKAKP